MNTVHTPFEVDQARNAQLDQLRANAKAHKKQIDRLTARLGQVTQQRDDAAAQLMVKEEAAFFRAEFEQHCNVKRINIGGCEGYMMRSKRGVESVVPLTAWLIGFMVTAGGVTAYSLAKFMGVI